MHKYGGIFESGCDVTAKLAIFAADVFIIPVALKITHILIYFEYEFIYLVIIEIFFSEFFKEVGSPAE